MTAPDRTTWTVAEDADGDLTLWHGDTAVLRRFELNAHTNEPARISARDHVQNVLAALADTAAEAGDPA